MSQPALAYQQQPMQAHQQFAEQPYSTQYPSTAEQIMVPGSTLAAQPIYSSPGMASGPVFIPQADPAHATESVTGLPIVSPY